MDLAFDFRPVAGADPARAALEQSERLLACYQAALGHELPNRLVAIQGMARLLEFSPDTLDAESRGLLENLAGLTRKANELVRAVSVIGRLCRDVRKGGFVEPREAVVEAVTEVNLLLPGRSIEYDLEDNLPNLPIHGSGLHQVLTQLLRNAARSIDSHRLPPSSSSRTSSDRWNRA